MNLLESLTQGAPAATITFALTVIASLAGLYARPSLIDASVFRPYWLFRRGEYARLVSNAFMHADLPHLLFNAFTFWAFAFPLERSIGSGAFVALYLFGMLTSDFGTWLAHRHESGYRTLGASGAILAVLFAAIVHAPGSSIFILPIPVPIPAPWFAVGYLAFSYYGSRRSVGHVNHDAHFSGALAGIAFVALTDGAALMRALRSVFG